jgi:hypothetical protein
MNFKSSSAPPGASFSKQYFFSCGVILLSSQKKSIKSSEMKLLTCLITVHRLIQRKQSICSRFAGISCAELAQKRVKEKFNILTSKIAKFILNSLLQRLASRRNLKAARIPSPESIKKLPEAIHGKKG